MLQADNVSYGDVRDRCIEKKGRIIVPGVMRKPINAAHLNYGRLGWLLLHFVLITTVFLGGFYLGRVTLIK
ncbi:hypothetical protein PCCS19_34720 [Paenibacillus sp. CCS19]|nr:hypothetical protein PCCS19_34720 [Paenibacillus cellulosilyticus]